MPFLNKQFKLKCLHRDHIGVSLHCASSQPTAAPFLSSASSAGDQGPHVGRELQDHDGGREADGEAGAGQPAG